MMPDALAGLIDCWETSGQTQCRQVPIFHGGGLRPKSMVAYLRIHECHYSTDGVSARFGTNAAQVSELVKCRQRPCKAPLRGEARTMEPG